MADYSLDFQLDDFETEFDAGRQVFVLSREIDLILDLPDGRSQSSKLKVTLTAPATELRSLLSQADAS